MESRLEELRRSRKMTQQELARLLGLTQQSIHQYEKMTVQPDLGIIKKMADIFHVPVDYLICHDCPDEKVHVHLSRDELLFIESIRLLSRRERAFLNRVIKLIVRRSEAGFGI